MYGEIDVSGEECVALRKSLRGQPLTPEEAAMVKAVDSRINRSFINCVVIPLLILCPLYWWATGP